MSKPTPSPHVELKKAEGIVCVTLEIHLSSLSRRITQDDLVATNPELQDLPPNTLTTMGSAKICDPALLKPLAAIKRKAETLLRRSGLPLLGTTGIPDGHLDAVANELESLRIEFNYERDVLERNFKTAVVDWLNMPEHRKWQGLITNIPSAASIMGKFSFGYHFCRVAEPSLVPGSALNRVFQNQFTGLKGELFAEASKEAQTFIEKSLKGANQRREKITQKTLRPLVRLAKKFRNFAFLDHQCEPIATMIEYTLDTLPKTGPIDGVHIMHVWALAEALADPDKTVAMAHLTMDSHSSGEAFQRLLDERNDGAQKVAATGSHEGPEVPVYVTIETPREPVAPEPLTTNAFASIFSSQPNQRAQAVQLQPAETCAADMSNQVAPDWSNGFI